MRIKERIENEITDRARVQVRFCSHFSFSRSPFPVPCSPSPSPIPILVTSLDAMFHVDWGKEVRVLLYVCRNSLLVLLVDMGWWIFSRFGWKFDPEFGGQMFERFIVV